MSAPVVRSGPNIWAIRRARALELVAEAPHAEEILATYADLTVIQEEVADRIPVGAWLARVSSAAEGPRLSLDRLPVDELVPLFHDFLAGAAGLGPDLLRAHARDLAAGLEVDTAGTVGGIVFARALAPERSSGELAPFHVRAFLQPVVTTLAVADPIPLASEADGRCPSCGSAPVVGALQDLPDAVGSLSLICGVCAGAWRVPRLTCARCGESDAERLVVHTADSLTHVRLDACESCGAYVKTVDLRRRGDAVPLVDDLATVELDLWAGDQGLERVQVNLFGL